MKVELKFSNYATKADLKNATGFDTSKFTEKVDLASLKSDKDKLDIDKLRKVPTGLNSLKSKIDKSDVGKLVPVPVDLSKLSNVVKNYVVTKTEYNAKIKNIEDKVSDITNLATNTINVKINEIKGEIFSITNLVTTTALNAKANEVKNKIPSITNLAPNTAVTSVENKIPNPNVSNLVKKIDYNTKISDIENKITTDHDHDKYITIPEFNRLTSENFAVRLAQANLASKSDITNFLKKTDFDDKSKHLTKKITSNKPKHVLVENELKKTDI